MFSIRNMHDCVLAIGAIFGGPPVASDNTTKCCLKWLTSGETWRLDIMLPLGLDLAAGGGGGTGAY